MLLNKIKNYFSSEERLRKKLLTSRFKYYKEIIEKSKGVITWEKLEEYSIFHEDWILISIYWEWNLDLSWVSIEFLVLLKGISWDLYLTNSKIKDLIISKIIKWSLYLNWSLIENLKGLEYVWKDLDLSWITIDTLSNILYEIGKKEVKIWWKIIYNWTNMKPYMGIYNSMNINSYIKIYNFLIYLQDFEDKDIDKELINVYKEELISIYWTWKMARSNIVKKQLSLFINIFYVKFIENYLKEIEKINLMKNNWVCEEERKNYAKEVYKKLEEKLDYIEYYFWEEIKNRICNELQRAIWKTN